MPNLNVVLQVRRPVEHWLVAPSASFAPRDAGVQQTKDTEVSSKMFNNILIHIPPIAGIMAYIVGCAYLWVRYADK